MNNMCTYYVFCTIFQEIKVNKDVNALQSCYYYCILYIMQLIFTVNVTQMNLEYSREN